MSIMKRILEEHMFGSSDGKDTNVDTKYKKYLKSAKDFQKGKPHTTENNKTRQRMLKLT